MTGSMIKKKTLLALAALFAACVLMMSCVRPAYANVDPTWEEEETVIPEQTPEETPPVVIPETTPAPVETEAPKQPETEVEEPEPKSPLENSNILILGAGAIVFALLYYFKIYKPGHEEEEEDDEGIEMGDGLPLEHEE